MVVRRKKEVAIPFKKSAVNNSMGSRETASKRAGWEGIETLEEKRGRSRPVGRRFILA